jgi:beta-galactosidase
MREKICFDSGWHFHEGDMPVPQSAYKGYMYTHAKTVRAITGPAAPNNVPSSTGINSDNWQVVNLPHDYVIRHKPEQQYNETLGFFPYNNAWYRKDFKLGPEDQNKRLTLLFEGVATKATIWVNGCLMGHSFTGYTPFEIDFTDVANLNGNNSVTVFVETDEHEGWWYEGAGIYRHVWLNKTALLSVDLYGIYVRPEQDEDGKWTCQLETTLRNDAFCDHEASICASIEDPQNNTIASANSQASLERKSKEVLRQSIAVANPTLWDTENPTLYTMRVKLSSPTGDDELCVRFGFRHLRFDPERGLFLNGKAVKIKGVCCHGDYGLTGKAVPDNIQRYRVRLLREMGANGYRCAHYPQSEATMDALDDYGFLVMAETRWFESTKEGREQLETLFRRDRNHPSIIMWSVGNEEPLFAKPEGQRIFETLYADAKRLDPSRPIMAAVANTPEQAPIFEIADLIGINYNLHTYENLRQKYPHKCFISSENCAVPSTRGFFFANSDLKSMYNAQDRTFSNWQTSREETWKFIMARDWVAGGYQWAGIEHRGETLWPRLCSQSGALDLFLQKKDAFYQNQSHWTDKPMLHLLPHWNFRGREGEAISVWAYSNCQEVELFLNGKSLGRKAIERFGHGEWTVPYAPGELSAIGYIDGKESASASKVTSGPPAALKLRLENGDDIRGNGRDLAVITCYVVDADGREVPDASPHISFDCNQLGAIVGTGSDICDHVPPHIPERRMRAGLCALALRCRAAGQLKVYASAPGLQSAYLDFELT